MGTGHIKGRRDRFETEIMGGKKVRGTEKLDALLKNFVEMERGPAGCALTVRLGEEILYEGYQGYADEGAGKKLEEILCIACIPVQNPLRPLPL